MLVSRLLTLLILLAFCHSALAGERPRPHPKPQPEPAPQPEPEPEPEPEDDVLDEYSKLASSFAKEAMEEKEIFYYQCKNIRASSLKRILENFTTASGTVADSDESDIVVVSDIKSHVEELKKIAETVDRPVPQILVEAQIVEITLDSDFEKELSHALKHVSTSNMAFINEIFVNLKTPGGNPLEGQGSLVKVRPYTRNYGSGNYVKKTTLETFLRYLETRGKARILSAPNLVLRRGFEGTIRTGDQVPISEQTVTGGAISTSTKFKDVGITLRVKPTMISGDNVRLSVSPEVSTVTSYVPTGENLSNPVISVRSADTQLDVTDGQLISIGGLLKNEERSVRRRVPVMSAIPGLGHFFRSTRMESLKTQLVIFLHIRILRPGDRHGLYVRPAGRLPQGVQENIDSMEEEMKRPKATVMDDVRFFMREGEEK